MELVKTVLLMQLAEALQPWFELRNLIRVVTGNPKEELAGPPLIIDNKAKLQRVELQMRGLKLHQEGVHAIENTIASAPSLLEKLNAASPLSRSDWIRYDAIFIEPFSLPFHELVALMKGQYLQSNPIVEAATDLGLVFDIHEGETVKHVQIGPMEAQQLRSMFLVYSRENTPERFVFINVGYERKQAALDAASLEVFFQAATKWHTDQAQTIVNQLRTRRS